MRVSVAWVKLARKRLGGGGLDPGNVVEKLEAGAAAWQKPNGVNECGAGAADPDGAVGFEDALAGGEPGAVEFMIGARTLGFVPNRLCLTLTMPPGVAGDAGRWRGVGAGRRR